MERPSRQPGTELLGLTYDALRRLYNTAELHEGLKEMGRWDPVLADRLHPLLQAS